MINCLPKWNESGQMEIRSKKSLEPYAKNYVTNYNRNVWSYIFGGKHQKECLIERCNERSCGWVGNAYKTKHKMMRQGYHWNRIE